MTTAVAPVSAQARLTIDDLIAPRRVLAALPDFVSDAFLGRIQTRHESIVEEDWLEPMNALHAEFHLEDFASDHDMQNWYVVTQGEEQGKIIGRGQDTYDDTDGEQWYNWPWEIEDFGGSGRWLCMDALAVARIGDDTELLFSEMQRHYSPKDIHAAFPDTSVTVYNADGSACIYDGHNGGVLLCNANTAEKVGEAESQTPYTSDFDYYFCTIYRAPEGHCFAVGEGHAHTDFASGSDGCNSGYGYATVLWDCESA